MKTVGELLNIDSTIEIYGIVEDSREVRNGYMFVATKGFHVDHFDYIRQAIDAGCSFLVVDREIDFDFPHIIVENILDCYHELCIKFYDLVLSKFHFIGITGTDGKTTTATIVKELIGDCAYIGTNGLMIRDKEYPTSNTTPCISELYAILKKIQDADVMNVVMEVSSEALLHDRVSHLLFDEIAFTNITGDHMNIHGNFENYVKSKLKLLDLKKKNGTIFVNGDDEHLKKLSDVCTFGFQSTNDFVIKSVNMNSSDTIISLTYGEKTFLLHSPFYGTYNVYNVVLAFLLAWNFGVNDQVLLDRIPFLKPVKGRGEVLDFGQDYTIVLDYAHTIHGVQNILETFKDYKRVITVTGAAGGREKEKRPIIGNLVMDKSDISIFTMDDPRYESVDCIIDDMVGDRTDYVRIVNREEAIFYALDLAREGDVVLILGKGRDDYMAIGDKKIKYSDYDVICKYFM